MNIQNNNNDRALRQLIQKSRLDMPFSDFEAHLMELIKTEVKKEKSITMNMRLSWLFFGLGTIFGLLSAILLINSDAVLLGLPFSTFSIPIFILAGTAFFWQIEQLLRFTRERAKT